LDETFLKGDTFNRRDGPFIDTGPILASTLLGCTAHCAFGCTLHNPSQDFYRSLERQRIVGTPPDRLRCGFNFAMPHAVSGLSEIGGKRANVLWLPILIKITKGSEPTEEPLCIGAARAENGNGMRQGLVRIASYRPFRCST
jgi:hypothetical protein